MKLVRKRLAEDWLCHQDAAQFAPTLHTLTDTEKIFRQESSFMYIFGVREASFYATIEVATGTTTLYMPRLPVEYAVWMGRIQPPQFFKVCQSLT